VFNKKLEPIEVYDTDDGDICIKQPAYGMEEDAIIIVTPEQVPLLINWLQDACDHLKQRQDNPRTGE
jgi:hypothetical protein